MDFRLLEIEKSLVLDHLPSVIIINYRRVAINKSVHFTVGVQCPLTSSLGEFPGYWDWFCYPWLSPVLVSNAFPFAFHICVFFHSPLFTCHWISFVYFSQWRYLHLVTNPPPVSELGTGTAPQLTRSGVHYHYIITTLLFLSMYTPQLLFQSKKHHFHQCIQKDFLVVIQLLFQLNTHHLDQHVGYVLETHFINHHHHHHHHDPWEQNP